MRLVVGLILFPSVAAAQISTDGTLGPQQSLSGSTIRIAPSLGQQRGGNLFHSFSQFNVNSGQTVVFDGQPGATQRVISRVSGGNVSRINGTLQSAIPGADFCLINPAGVIFGPGATIDIPGRFAVTTADSVSFEDGTTFPAQPGAAEVLSSAAPSAFGFLPTNAGLIRVHDTSLVVPSSSFTGARIELDRAIVQSSEAILTHAAVTGQSLRFFFQGDPTFFFNDAPPNGSLYLTNGSTIGLAAPALGVLDVRAGRIGLSGQSEIDFATAAVDEGSFMSVTANQLTLRENSTIQSLTFGTARGPGVLIGAKVIDLDAAIISSASLLGEGGAIQVVGQQLRMAHRSSIRATNALNQSGDLLVNVRQIALRSSGLSTVANAGSIGKAGNLQVIANQIDLRDGSVIASSTAGEGAAGDLTIRARDHLIARGSSVISSDSFETGKVGTGAIDIISPQIVMDRSIISSTTSGIGSGKTVSLTTTDDGIIVLTGPFSNELQSSGIITFSGADLPVVGGNSGSVSVRAGTLIISNGASISASTTTAGRAGDVDIVANDFSLIGTGQEISSGFFSSVNSQTEQDTPGAGAAGNITISGGTLRITRSGVITSSTFGDGPAGNVIVNVDRLLISGVETGIGSISGVDDDPATGAAGSVIVNARDGIDLSNRGKITVEGQDATGGNIDLASGGSIFLTSDAIFSAASGGDGGNIRLSASDSIAITDSEITASAGASGENARIVLDRAKQAVLGNSTINGQAGGVDVLVQITTDNLLLAGSTQILSDRTVIPFNQSNVTIFQALPVIGLDRGTQLQADCAVQTIGNTSSFVVQSRGGVIDRDLRFESR